MNSNHILLETLLYVLSIGIHFLYALLLCEQFWSLSIMYHLIQSAINWVHKHFLIFQLTQVGWFVADVVKMIPCWSYWLVSALLTVLIQITNCNRLLSLGTMQEYMNICLDGNYHKKIPGPEDIKSTAVSIYHRIIYLFIWNMARWKFKWMLRKKKTQEIDSRKCCAIGCLRIYMICSGMWKFNSVLTDM